MTNDSHDQELPQIAENPQTSEVGGVGEVCSPESGCPQKCRTTMLVRGFTVSLVLIGTVAFGALKIKPELAEYIPLGNAPAAHSCPLSRASCSSCASESGGCPCHAADATTNVACSDCGATCPTQCHCHGGETPVSEGSLDVTSEADPSVADESNVNATESTKSETVVGADAEAEKETESETTSATAPVSE